MSQSVFVIGAGAAGMMAAVCAAARGYDVTVFEKNEKPGKKLYITGKGRCNITNACDIEDLFQNIVTNKKFMYSSLYGFDNQAVIDFFEQHGLHTKVERGNRVFPISDKSSDVISVLKTAMQKAGVRIRYMTNVEDIIVEQDCVKGVIFSNGKKEWTDNVILATGGLSYPVTGSDGMGMEILARHGHKIIPTRPALVPMNVKEEFIKEMQGLSLKNVRGAFYLKSKQGKKPVYEEFGEMLFTHFGISGPIVLSASSFLAKYISKEEVIFKIDLKPALSFGQLDDRILREFEKNRNRDFKNSLDDLLPKKMIPVMIAYCGIDPYKKLNRVVCDGCCKKNCGNCFCGSCSCVLLYGERCCFRLYRCSGRQLVC